MILFRITRRGEQDQRLGGPGILPGNGPLEAAIAPETPAFSGRPGFHTAQLYGVDDDAWACKSDEMMKQRLVAA
jgi:hypothetical protein